MPRVNMNLNNVPDNVEPGWYPVQVESAEIRTTQDGQGEFIRWDLKIIDPDSEFNGWPLRVNTPIKLAPGKDQRALRITKDFLRAAEIEWDEDGFDTEDVLGAELEVQVQHRTWQGRVQEDVTSFRPL